MRRIGGLLAVAGWALAGVAWGAPPAEAPETLPKPAAVPAAALAPPTQAAPVLFPHMADPFPPPAPAVGDPRSGAWVQHRPYPPGCPIPGEFGGCGGLCLGAGRRPCLTERVLRCFRRPATGRGGPTPVLRPDAPCHGETVQVEQGTPATPFLPSPAPPAALPGTDYRRSPAPPETPAPAPAPRRGIAWGGLTGMGRLFLPGGTRP